MPSERELSLRAVLTGTVLGIFLTPSNVYAGLKIGWSFNMSVIALLIGFGIWQGFAARFFNGPDWTLHESNINQTVASAAASIISGGLVAPLPAYTLLTGSSLQALPMMAWVFSVSFLGIWIAWYLRESLVNDEELKFPESVATLETLRQIYSHGREAAQRLRVLSGATLLSGLTKWIDEFQWALPRWSPIAQMERLTFVLDPSLLLAGFGCIIGMRVGLSLLLGAILAWGGIGPWLIAEGQVKIATDSTGPQFAALIEWLLWPGVSLMVCSALTALAIRLARRRTQGQKIRLPDSVAPERPNRRWIPALGLGLAILLVVVLQSTLFGIDVFMALLSIPLAVCLAAVAARIVGTTGIPPIGAIGQLSQLGFGLIAPGQIPVNLMSANTAGGSAGQCTDLMNDFKVGKMIGATPWKQTAAQCLGIAVGSVVGVLAYQALIPDPQGMLLSEEWPAPAAATWKAVAQTLSTGIDSLPSSVRWAIAAAGLAGILIAILEAVMSGPASRLIPSAGAFALAFIIPASISLTMSAGAILTWLVGMKWPALKDRYAIVAAAGLIAGESMMGVGASLWRLFFSQE